MEKNEIRTFSNTIHKTKMGSVAQSCPTLCDPMDCSTPGFPVHHQLPELRQDTIKLSEGNKVRTVFDISCSNIFFGPSPIVIWKKKKMNKWDPIKFKSFLFKLENHKQNERPPTEWEKIFANNTIEKGLISKI